MAEDRNNIWLMIKKITLDGYDAYVRKLTVTSILTGGLNVGVVFSQQASRGTCQALTSKFTVTISVK